MLNTDKLFSDAMSLPIEIRMALVNKLLESLNPTQKEIDSIWSEEVEKRIDEVESGKVKFISGAEVFSKIKKKYNL